MLLTGGLLVFVTTKIMFQQATRGVDDLDMPLWIGSTYLQAEHLIFNIQFDHDTRENLKNEFREVRDAALQNLQPYPGFFDFVRFKRPEFGSGRQYNSQTVMDALIQSMSSSDTKGQTQVVRLVHQMLQTRSGTPESRLDDFMNKMNTLSLYRSPLPMGGGAFPTQRVYQPIPPPPPPVHPPADTDTTHASANQDSGSGGSVPFS
ncbi:hypothetical protein, conserved [Angomonas deanei]|uniref:Uncharacterized protein n=1 Tax=Angomonas deanei TaxID=59799 RepID=A0A7G2CM69_9TRYP|nr:hypothetical protein, conserved [Angomonas deanei]